MPVVFLIEDNTLLRESTKTLLELNGFEVFAFEAGEPALDQFEESTPDLVLCDIILPGINGYEILGRVRQMPTGGDIPFVFLSALADKERVRESMNLGADDHLTKPFTSESLLAAIRTRIKLSQNRRSASERRVLPRALSSLPHEMRTSLNGVLGGISLLRNGEHGLGSDEKQALDLLEESAIRLEKTALNYILFLSLCAGHEPLLAEIPVDAGTLVKSAATKLALEAGRENDLFLRVLEAPTRHVDSLGQITSQLVSNALKFSKPGSNVIVEMAKEKGRLILRCRDYGCGMTKGEIAAIGPFKQFHRKKREQQGLGLGLAICQAMAACAGGHLAFTPEKPGLTVEFSIPEL